MKIEVGAFDSNKQQFDSLFEDLSIESIMEDENMNEANSGGYLKSLNEDAIANHVNSSDIKQMNLKLKSNLSDQAA